MYTIEFTSDSYNFLNNSSTLHYISIFNITLDVFIILKVYLCLTEYIILISRYWMPCVWIFCTNQL